MANNKSRFWISFFLFWRKHFNFKKPTYSGKRPVLDKYQKFLKFGFILYLFLKAMFLLAILPWTILSLARGKVWFLLAQNCQMRCLIGSLWQIQIIGILVISKSAYWLPMYRSQSQYQLIITYTKTKQYCI